MSPNVLWQGFTRILAASLVCCLLAGCLGRAAVPTPAVSSLTTATPAIADSTATAAIEPGATASPTPTRTPPANTATTSPTSTPASWMALKTWCPDIMAGSPADLKAVGKLMFFSTTSPFAVDMATGNREPLSDEWNFWDWELSPGGKWLSHYLDEQTLEVMSPAGEIQATIHFEDNWGYREWLDDEHWLITRFVEPDAAYPRGVFAFASLNPFTGERKELPLNYPDFNPIPLKMDGRMLSPDSTLTRVAYLFRLPSGQTGFRLVNVETGQILASVLLGYTEFNVTYPLWSPDGQQVLVSGIVANPPQDTLDNFFAIGRDGTVTQLTDLGAYNADIDTATLFHNYSWSPDGRYIAFWLDGEPEKWNEPHDYHLAILKVKEKEVTDYCIPDITTHANDAPVWAPDSRQVVVASGANQDIVLLDIEQEKAFAILTDLHLRPIYWLEKIPQVWLKLTP